MVLLSILLLSCNKMMLEAKDKPKPKKQNKHIVGLTVLTRQMSKSNELIGKAGAGELGAVLELIADGADVNDFVQGTNALYWAAHGDHANVIQALLDAGADINALNNGGITALHRAVMSGSSGAVEILLNRGANINAIDAYNRTALSLANREDIIALLHAAMGVQ